MFTVCPKCALTLVVTAADLRVAQGYVRCGRCSSVFNALAQLSDERGAARAAEAAASEPGGEPEAEAEPEAEPEAEAEPEPQPEPVPPPPPARTPVPPPAAQEEGIPEDALEFNPEKTDAASVFVPAPPNPEWTAATGSFKALVAANQEAPAAEPAPANEDLDIELDAALLSQIVENQPRAPEAAAPPPAPHKPAPHKPPAPRKPPAPQRLAAAPLPAAPAPAPQAPEPELEAQPGPLETVAPAPRRAPWLWTAAAVLLVLVLVAQTVNHRRDALATDPHFGAALTALYASLGVPLMPRWDLHAYDVRQLGATVAPSAAAGGTGAITVRASIRNAGPKPQPLPLLRVTLQDRFGNRIASRDVSPRDYLPHSVAPGALLAVDQRIDAELAFVDPGSSAVGFELDACLAMRGGVACANDTSAR
jgi:predicted Zn finger-like uncharacterized protein